jgi:protein-disulfide isomerase
MATLASDALGGLRDLVSSAGSTVATTLLAIVAVVLIASFPKPEQRPYVPPLQPLAENERLELEKWFDLQPKVDLPFPHNQAKVVIVKFNDYQCPPCRGTYFAFEPVVAKYKDRPQDVSFILKHFPLDPKCNPGVTNVAHPAACDAAAAAVMAQSHGTFDKLTDWFFMHQDKLTPALVRSAASDVAGIKDFDARYTEALAQVRADATIGQKLGVESTPTFFINQRKIAGGISASALDAIIELELRRAAKQP